MGVVVPSMSSKMVRTEWSSTGWPNNELTADLRQTVAASMKRQDRQAGNCDQLRCRYNVVSSHLDPETNESPGFAGLQIGGLRIHIDDICGNISATLLELFYFGAICREDLLGRCIRPDNACRLP